MPPFDGNLGFKCYAPINNISINIFVGKKKKKMQMLFAAPPLLPPTGKATKSELPREGAWEPVIFLNAPEKFL